LFDWTSLRLNLVCELSLIRSGSERNGVIIFKGFGMLIWEIVLFLVWWTFSQLLLSSFKFVLVGDEFLTKFRSTVGFPSLSYFSWFLYFPNIPLCYSKTFCIILEFILVLPKNGDWTLSLIELLTFIVRELMLVIDCWFLNYPEDESRSLWPILGVLLELLNAIPDWY